MIPLPHTTALPPPNAREADRRAGDQSAYVFKERRTDALVVLDADGVVLHAGPSTPRLLGYRATACVGRDAFAHVHPDDRSGMWGSFLRLRAHPGTDAAVECRYRHGDGSWRWLAVTATNLLAAPRFQAIVVNYRDITARKGAEEALRASEERFRATFEQAAVGIAHTRPTGEWLHVNQRLCAIVGYTREELVQRTFQELTHPDDLPADLAQTYRLLAGEIATYTMEKRYFHKSGLPVWVALTVSLVRDDTDQPQYFIAVVEDITARRHAEAQLRHFASHDSLTGLPNRALFMARLKRCLARAKRRDDPFAVLLLDLDRFKVVNDSLGHLHGDRLLVAVARRLATAVRAGDTVARLGGDEFAILFAGGEEEAATEAAERIQTALAMPMTVRGQPIVVTASIGIAWSTDDYRHPEDVLRDADTALYRAKARGRGKVQLFDAAMHAEAVLRLQLEGELRQAVAREEFVVHYQPIVALAHREIVGFEALTRWRHPQRGLLAPAVFLPLAVETGLILLLDAWVMGVACRQLRRWQGQFPGVPPLTIRTNLAGAHLAQPDLPERLAALLEETGLPVGSLSLEITEGSLIENDEAAAATLVRLRGRGVGVQLDDFGTGYSSLSYLRRFPIDTLKIDRSFVMGMGEAKENLEIVRVIIALAHNLGIAVVAEGVETAEQRERLTELGCEYGQGIHFAPPLDAAEATALLARNGHP